MLYEVITMFERDQVDVLMGEISSASAKTIMQVAERNKRLFMSTGPRSDALRGEFCNRYTFHVDIPVTVMVNAEGQGLLREGLIKGQRIYALTSDYLFGHDLAKAAKKFVTAHGGTVIADDLVSTDTTDFSPYLLKVRQAKPDLIATNLGGNQVTRITSYNVCYTKLLRSPAAFSVHYHGYYHLDRPVPAHPGRNA